MTTHTLKKHIAGLPSGPGIYMFKDARKKDLYIGKATNLKGRVNSYLKTEDQKIRKMTELAQSLKFISTQSDIEALILESQLIKKFRPQFNIVMRDDKQYFYVGFGNENFPKIFITHQPTKLVYSSQFTVNRLETVNSKLETSFIGPFTDGNALKITLRFLRRIFPYCTCKQLHHNYCLNYHIGKCAGFCCLKSKATNEKEKIYLANINAIRKVLNGKKNSLVKELKKSADSAARKDDFEKAIGLRDKIEKLERVFENARILRSSEIIKINRSGLESLLKIPKPIIRIEGYDISNIQGIHATGSMVTFINGQPDKNFYRKFKIRRILPASGGFGDVQMLAQILERRFRHDEWPFPDFILIDGGKVQVNAARAAISNVQFSISKKIPIIGLAKNKKHIGEKIYISNKRNPIALTKLSPTDKNLLLMIDSEAHRFAINFYRSLHRKKLKGPSGSLIL